MQHRIDSIVSNDGSVIFFCSACGTERFELPCEEVLTSTTDTADVLAIELGLFTTRVAPRAFSYHDAIGAALDAA